MALMQKKNPYAFAKQTLKIFWDHAKKYPRQVVMLIVGILSVAALVTYTPLLYRDLLNLLTRGGPGEIIPQAFRIVFFVFIANVIRQTLWRASNFANNFFQSRVMSDLTNTCYEYLQKHSLGFFNSSFVGSLVTKVKRYERAFEQITDQLVFDLGRS
ncbi:MAG: hypothetical protein AAB967_03485, partial [Patescibacteria group bacterium]